MFRALRRKRPTIDSLFLGEACIMRDLLTALTKTFDQNRDCVYCALVETRGSTPQKAGAAMLVFPDGSQHGTLGGGCVEAEVKQKALHVLHTGGGQPALLHFDLDDNYGWDDGLICGGRMSILADPLTLQGGQRRGSDYYRRYHAVLEQGSGCTEAVILEDRHVDLPVASRFLFDSSGSLVTSTAAGAVPEAVLRNLAPLQKRPGPSVRQGVAYLPNLPRITLLIVGGGHVGLAVARLAADVDFEIWVVDDREAYVSRERFPMARHILIGDIGQTLKGLEKTIHPSMFCLVVTRGHAHDEEALYHLATSPAGYVGMIGSKRKIRLIFEDLLAKGIPAEALQRVHAPLGFDIGSQTVPEIAVSIVAELIACRNLGSTIREARTWVPVGKEQH
jgi:xanthine dehydrogenase accessory factor